MKKKNRSVGDRIFDSINGLFMLLFAFLCVYPFYYIIIYSISDPIQAQRGVYFLPIGFTLDNYKTVLAIKGIARAVLISVSITVISTLESMFIAGMTGYLLSRQNMPYRKIVYRFFIVTMYVGGGLIPSFLLMKYLHLYNTYWIYIIPGVAAYNTILTKTYIEGLPASLEESAKMDGASYWTIAIRIIFPLCKPILATIGVFTAVGKWCDYGTTLIYIIDKDLETLQYVLYQKLRTAQDLAKQSASAISVGSDFGRQLTPMSIQMTLLCITVTPILCVYPYMQKYFVKGITLGSVKG